MLCCKFNVFFSTLSLCRSFHFISLYLMYFRIVFKKFIVVIIHVYNKWKFYFTCVKPTIESNNFEGDEKSITLIQYHCRRHGVWVANIKKISTEYIVAFLFAQEIVCAHGERTNKWTCNSAFIRPKTVSTMAMAIANSNDGDYCFAFHSLDYWRPREKKTLFVIRYEWINLIRCSVLLF